MGLAPENPSTTDGTYYSKPSTGIPVSDLSAEIINALGGVVAVSNKNYLDNAWFTINQRGLPNVASMPSNTYISDRWFTGTDDEVDNRRSLLIDDNGI